MYSDRWTTPAGSPDAVSGGTRPDRRRENESRTKDDEPGGAAVDDVVGFPSFGGTRLISGAEKVLRRNDMGGWTKAAPNLYPHQWSWDSAFIAIGLAHLDTRRAARELETLFAHQWKTGKVPHIVFNRDASPRSYFPGPEHWACAASSPDAPPAPPYTSCLSQPPVHAIAALRIREAVGRRDEEDVSFALAFLKGIYPKLLSWHRYLLTYRDPEGSGLVTIYHPWGSGTDNSPRWDDALEAVEVGDVGPYPRYDLEHVEDASQRPTDAEYDRYLWLMELIKRAHRCDEASVYETHPFLVKDVLTSAILVAANEALLEIAGLVEAPERDHALITGWIERGRRGLEGCWDREFGLCLDYDLRAERPLRVRTVAGFAPLIAGGLDPERLDFLIETLDSPAFAGNPRLRWPLPPSTSPEDPRFDPRSYWRGPTWPVVNWLLWRSLVRAGEKERAEDLRRAALEQLSERGFGEYFEPFTGQLLGSADQSWTAAVALDWLAYGSPREEGVSS
ncbi:MAG: glycogen debranching protein [Actinomycetota bacterium]|nr:glycogen debranching protein [Actinomycetota bacterium]